VSPGLKITWSYCYTNKAGLNRYDGARKLVLFVKSRYDASAVIENLIVLIVCGLYRTKSTTSYFFCERSGRFIHCPVLSSNHPVHSLSCWPWSANRNRSRKKEKGDGKFAGGKGAKTDGELIEAIARQKGLFVLQTSFCRFRFRIVQTKADEFL